MAAAPTVAAPSRIAVSSAVTAPIADAIADKASGAFKRFYRTRNYTPLWFTSGEIAPQAGTLIGYLRTAKLDGLKPSTYDPDRLVEDIEKARGGEPKEIARAEIALSKAFVSYVRDQRKPAGDIDVSYADKTLKPKKLKTEQILHAASFPKSFSDYVADMGWMSDEYVRMRALMARNMTQKARDRLALNLDRARILPGPWIRHITVNAASGELYWFQAGKRLGKMRVVVGAAKTQTPMLVGSITWAVINPYWNVPDYLARDSIAKKVLRGRTLKMMHMEALSDWSANATVVPPKSIDWQAVASGAVNLRIRQLPGPYNSMGKVKFVFPNTQGIYLHDTPERDLLAKSDRHFSNGCIRLDKAMVLGKWLLGHSVGNAGGKPEASVALPVPVPVYLTYITAETKKTGIAFLADVYGRDAKTS